ncbi:MAG TPA: hypothetical protein PLL33_03920, partial [Paracoccus sp. (in: a-proteobacteria)]|nr:hypothetical protein [Paracoccus sp. (in: a-proteobacteria)]
PVMARIDSAAPPRPSPEVTPPRESHARRMVEIPMVAPGMVPRESDYAPSVTVTEPEEITVVQVTPMAASAAPLPDSNGNPPVRPDVEPLAPQAEANSR